MASLLTSSTSLDNSSSSTATSSYGLVSTSPFQFTENEIHHFKYICMDLNHLLQEHAFPKDIDISYILQCINAYVEFDIGKQDRHSTLFWRSLGEEEDRQRATLKVKRQKKRKQDQSTEDEVLLSSNKQSKKEIIEIKDIDDEEKDQFQCSRRSVFGGAPFRSYRNHTLAFGSIWHSIFAHKLQLQMIEEWHKINHPNTSFIPVASYRPFLIIAYATEYNPDKMYSITDIRGYMHGFSTKRDIHISAISYSKCGWDLINRLNASVSLYHHRVVVDHICTNEDKKFYNTHQFKEIRATRRVTYPFIFEKWTW